MLTTIKRRLSQSMPISVRNWVWYLTDAGYRTSYRKNQERISALRAAQNEAGEIILSRHGSSVLSGPFQGLNYFERLGPTVPTHKIFGTYEKELWPVVEEICQRNYRTIIDIGAAEGYYVVGLAGRLPYVQVIAFEAQTDLHARIKELAARNRVSDRITIRGLCDATSLKSVFVDAGTTLVVCDIEGAEEHVLNPEDIPALRHVDVLVEVHEHLSVGVTDLLRMRFHKTHEIQEIASVSRVAIDCPPGVQLPEELSLLAMDESRSPESKWFWITRR